MAERRDTEVRREQIAAAALELIGANGVGGLSLAAAASRVGLVPSAVYRHFGGRDDVLDAVIELIGERLRANVAAAREEAASPLERLHRLLWRHARFIEENQAVPRLAFSEEVHVNHPGRRESLYRVVREFAGAVADLVREGQEQGEIRPELDPGTVSLLFLGLLQPAAVFWRLSAGAFDVAAHLGRAWELFRAAVCAPAEGRPS